MPQGEQATPGGAIEGPLLPPGLVWVHLLGPIGLVLIMAKELHTIPLPELMRVVGSKYIPFLAFGLSFEAIYRWLMPSLLGRLRSAWARFAAHAFVIIGVTFVVALFVHPLMQMAAGHRSPFKWFVVMATVISAVCLIPALLIQRTRLRALAAERSAIAERQAALQAQLEALQARTDPHFLFNSLNTVAALIPEDPKQAERALEQLADLFRYALESSRTRAVPLRREVAMISDYLALQSARFGERLRTHVELDDAIADVQVPPLLLQPLVENAILHGTARRRGGEVRVSARKDGDCVVIEVTDDGPGPGASSHSGSGSAISTLSERLRLHYSGRGEIALHTRSDGGCLARMVLPLSGSA